MFHFNLLHIMRHLAATMLCCLACCPLLLPAQHMGNIRLHAQARPAEPTPQPQLNPQHLTLEVNVLANVQPDAHLAILNVLQVGETAWEADSLMRERLEGFFAELQPHGIDREDIFVDMISQIALYEFEVEKKLFSKTYNEVPAGFELQKNLHLSFQDGQLLDRILTAAARHEIYDLVKVEYQVADQAGVIQQLRDTAISFLAAQLASYRRLGLEPDSLYRIFSEATSISYPDQRYQAYQSHSQPQGQSYMLDQKTKRTEQRKAQTYFYQALSPAPYEVVVDPLIKGPVVQFAHSLTVQFSLPPAQPPKPEIRTEVRREKEFILVTPDGKVVPLEVRTE